MPRPLLCLMYAVIVQADRFVAEFRKVQTSFHALLGAVQFRTNEPNPASPAAEKHCDLFRRARQDVILCACL